MPNRCSDHRSAKCSETAPAYQPNPRHCPTRSRNNAYCGGPFDRFYHVNDSHTRTHEGTGIGLSLVKELIDLLGGTISVESQPGKTTFALTRPIRLVEPTTQAPPIELSVTAFNETALTFDGATPTALPAQTDDAPLVLVAEDNAELRAFLVTELQTTYRVLTASNGQSGWEISQSKLPNVVISDVMMPLMDGYELTQRIKTSPDTDHIGVILLTAKADAESQLDGLKHGADDYIAKPFALDELRLRLHNLMFCNGFLICRICTIKSLSRPFT